MIRPCNDRMPWNRRQVNSVLRTNAGRSFVSKWELQPAGRNDGYNDFEKFSSRDGHALDVYFVVSGTAEQR